MALGDPYRAIEYEREAWRSLERWRGASVFEIADAIRARWHQEFRSSETLRPTRRTVDAVETVSTPARRELIAVEGLGRSLAGSWTMSMPPQTWSVCVTAWLTAQTVSVGRATGLAGLEELRAGNADCLARLIPVIAR